jgi:hypothetical protein
MVATTHRVSIGTMPLQNQRESRRAALSSVMGDCRLPAGGRFYF